MFDNIREDLRRAVPRNTQRLVTELMNPGTQAVILHRFGHWCLKLRVPVVRHLLLIIHWFTAYYARAVLGIYIHTAAEIGPGLVIHTWGGVFIPPIKVGRNLLISHGVVINFGCVSIGDDVRLHPGCKIAGGVRLGNRVCVGPNAVVTQDVPDDSTVLAAPVRTMRVHFAPKNMRGAADPESTDTQEAAAL